MWFLVVLELLHAARAACTYAQTTTPDAIQVSLRAGPGVVHCRTLTLQADRPLTVAGSMVNALGDRRRLGERDMRLLPGGGWEIAVPELAEGDALSLVVTPPVDGMTVALAPAGAAVDPAPVKGTLDQEWVFVADPRHPAWGFADPKFGVLETHRTWRFAADAPAQVVGHPADLEAAALPATVPVVPAGWRWPGGAGELSAAWARRGLPAQGVVQLPPGSLTLRGAGMLFEVTADSGVRVDHSADSVQIVAPQGGTVRWRVRSAGGNAVIPDTQTFIAGLDWRFRKASFPEPAPPVRLKGELVGPELMRELYRATRALLPSERPGTDPLAPRLLNDAWHSGWATSVERALILDRLLGQEHYAVDWVLTGVAPDPVTLTGYGHMLLRLQSAEGPIWLDPGCAVCALGEIDPRWMGQPALGPVEVVPRQPGSLVRKARITGNTYTLRFEATGAAAVWLRGIARDADPPALARKLGIALGVDEASLLGVSKDLRPDVDGLPAPWLEAVPPLLEGPKGTTILELRTTHAPRPPADGALPGWDGGWREEL